MFTYNEVSINRLPTNIIGIIEDFFSGITRGQEDFKPSRWR